MKARFSRSPTSFLYCLVCTLSVAQPNDQKIEDFLSSQLENGGIPGLATAIVQDGKAIYTSALGVSDLTAATPLTPEHNFHLASLSKTFVATAVLQLVEAGKLNLNSPIAEYLPYFELNDERFRHITLQQLLNHTSGMPDVEDYQYDNPQFDKGAAERWVRQMALEDLLSEPGEIFHYSDMAFDLLGDLIAKTSGSSFEDYMKTHIFQPLNMENSSFYYLDADEQPIASGHLGNPARISEIYPYNRRHAPSSTLNSSVNDMTHWMLANLNGGELNGHKILSPTYFDLLWTPTLDIPDGPQIGLSWFLVDIDGRKVALHGGRDIGFRSLMMIFPEDNTGLILASNWEDADLRTISQKLVNIIFHSDDSVH